MQDRTIVLLCTIPFFLGGLACIAMMLREILLARASKSWRVALGTISRSWVGAHNVDTADTAGGTAYLAHVEYQYEVDGQMHQGKRIRFGTQTYGKAEAAQVLVDRYPAGSQVNVLYDPARPARCTLEPALWWMVLIVFFLLGVMIVLGAGVVLGVVFLKS